MSVCYKLKYIPDGALSKKLLDEIFQCAKGSLLTKFKGLGWMPAARASNFVFQLVSKVPFRGRFINNASNMKYFSMPG